MRDRIAHPRSSPRAHRLKLLHANSDGVFDTISTLNSLAGSQKNWNLDAVDNWNSETTDGSTTNRTYASG